MIAVVVLLGWGWIRWNHGKGEKGMGVAAGELSTTHVLLVYFQRSLEKKSK